MLAGAAGLKRMCGEIWCLLNRLTAMLPSGFQEKVCLFWTRFHASKIESITSGKVAINFWGEPKAGQPIAVQPTMGT